MAKSKKLRESLSSKKKNWTKIIYYSSSLLLFFYFIFSIWELITLLQDRKRIIQVPILLLVFFTSIILPFWIIKYLSSKKNSLRVNIIFVSKIMILSWFALIVMLLAGFVSRICYDFSCWYLLLPIIWYAPNFVLSLGAFVAFRRKIKS